MGMSFCAVFSLDTLTWKVNKANKLLPPEQNYFEREKVRSAQKLFFVARCDG